MRYLKTYFEREKNAPIQLPNMDEWIESEESLEPFKHTHTQAHNIRILSIFDW